MHGPTDDALDCTTKGYDYLRAIGSGQFGRTYLVRRLDNGELRAAKRVDLSNLESQDVLAATKEPQFLAQFAACPYIVKLYESFVTTGGYLNIIMEYCQGGDMARCLNSMRKMDQRFTEAEIIVMLRQMLEALAMLHDNFVMHRDLKPSNILISGDGKLKLADFGVCRQLEATIERAKTHVGTPQYMPPEIIMNRPYYYPGDMWSLGCVLYELLTLKPAFEGGALMVGVKICWYAPVTPVGPEWSAPLRQIVAKLLAKDPTQRPLAKDLLRDNYLNAIPDPFSQVLSWDSPDRTLERVDEREEDANSNGASPVGVSALAFPAPSAGGQPQLISATVVRECEVILWRLNRALSCAEVPPTRAMLEHEPRLMEELRHTAEEVALKVENVASQSDCLGDMILEVLAVGGEMWFPCPPLQEKVWDAEVTTAWLLRVSSTYGADLSESECHKVLSTIAQVTGENVPSLKTFKRISSACGKLTAEYRAANDNLQDEKTVLNEVRTSIEEMYRRICEKVYTKSASVDYSLEEPFCSLVPDSDGGVPEGLVRQMIENEEGMGMTEGDVEDFLLLSFKTKNGYIRLRRTTSEMTNHSALPVALTQDKIPEVSTKIALLQSKSPEPVVVSVGAEGTPPVTMTTPQDVSTSFSSSKHSERVYKSPSVIHSELRSEGLSESGGGSGGIRPSCGGSADFSVGGGVGLCENCLHRSAKVASERSHWSRELSPSSLTGARHRDNSIFSDRGSVYTDANPEVEPVVSPSERADVLSLHRFATLPVEHGSWPERSTYGRYAYPHLPNTVTVRPRNPHNASGPLLGTGSNQRTPAAVGRKKKSSLQGRPDVRVRTSRNGPGLRTISPQELASLPTFQPGRAHTDRGANTHVHIVFSSDCAVPQEPKSSNKGYYSDSARIGLETLIGWMAESMHFHEHTIELLIVLYGEPRVTESQLRESIRGLAMEIESNVDRQESLLRRLKTPPAGLQDDTMKTLQTFYNIYLKAIRHHSGVKCELERLLKTEGRDQWGSGLHSRSNGTRYSHSMLNPASSASNVDRLGSLFARTETLLIYSAMELGSFTKQMLNTMQDVRIDNQGVAVCHEFGTILEFRNTALRKVLDPSFGGMDGSSGGGMCLEEIESGSLLIMCERIRRHLVSLEQAAIGDDGLIVPTTRRKAPLSTGLVDDRLPRHQSQISPRQRYLRRHELHTRESTPGLPRCTTDYPVNSHRHRDRHLTHMRSGFGSFLPDDQPTYTRRRFTSGSDHVRAVDEWTDSSTRCDCYRH